MGIALSPALSPFLAGREQIVCCFQSPVQVRSGRRKQWPIRIRNQQTFQLLRLESARNWAALNGCAEPGAQR